MKKILFATTNEGKLAEAKSILGIEVEGIALEIDEIQSLNSVEVASKKAEAYFKEIQTPLFIEDVSLAFSVLNGLPGVYINDFSKALGNEGLIDLLRETKDRTAVAKTTIAFIRNENDINIFEGIVNGTISENPRGDKGFGWDPIFIPEGSDKTFAEMEMEEKNKFSMRQIALQKLHDFLSST